MDIKVLGAQSSQTVKMYEYVEKVLRNNNLKESLSKVTESKEIISFGVLKTPALVIDRKVIIAGRLPSESEINAIILARI